MRFRIYYICSVLIALLSQNIPAAEHEPYYIHLKEIELQVSEHNRALATARRATEAGEAAVAIAGTRPNPTVSLNRSGISTARPTTTGNLDTILRIDQPIERGDKRELRLAVANSLLQANRSDELESLREQQLLACQAYFDLKAAEEKVKFGAESAKLDRAILAKAELRLKAGDLSPADVARIRTDVLKVESDAIQSRIELQHSRLVLARLLSLEAEAANLVTADPWLKMGLLPTLTPEIDERPDVVAARQRLDAAERAISLSKAQQVRDVTIGGQIERAPGESNSAMVGFGVSIPLFTGNNYQGEIRRAYIDRDSARDELERVRTAADAEYVQARFDAENLDKRAWTLVEEALPSARKVSAAIQLAFDHGAASVLDVIDARRSLYSIEIDTSNALADAAKARAALAATINHPDSNDK
jgi:outer membrane protein, heavy metal efflux system